jgi:hypothetical protein
MPGAPPSAATDSPESSASAIRPDASAAARAFTSALPAKVCSVSSGSARPSWLAAITSKRPSSNAASSRAFPGLWVAATIRASEGSRSAMAPKSRRAGPGASGPPSINILQCGMPNRILMHCETLISIIDKSP